jgi:acyl-coenzyme A thioesterase PaaI-like protein
VKAGRTLHVCQGVAHAGGQEVAIMQATMIALPARPGFED